MTFQIRFCTLSKIWFHFTAIYVLSYRHYLRHAHNIRIGFKHLISGGGVIFVALELAEVALDILRQFVLFDLENQLFFLLLFFAVIILKTKFLDTHVSFNTILLLVFYL